MALVIPSSVLSAIQIEAYKRYLLVSLLVHGEAVPLQGNVLGANERSVLRNCERLTGAYQELVRAYKLGVNESWAVVAERQEIFRKDHTLGLVKQAVQGLVRRNIARLTSTYLTLSLKDIAESASMKGHQDPEAIVLSMIDEGSIFAKINQRDGMITFLVDPEDYDTSKMVTALDGKIHEVIALSKKLQSLDRKIELNTDYIRKTMPPEKGAGGAMAADFDAADWEMKVHESSMM